MREPDMGERPHPDNAVIYARFSTKNQDPRSIDDQFRRCEEYAATDGEALGGRVLLAPAELVVDGARVLVLRREPGVDDGVVGVRAFSHVRFSHASPTAPAGTGGSSVGHIGSFAGWSAEADSTMQA